MKSVDIAKIMKEKLITQFGIPEEFVTDGGSNFTSAYMKKFFDENGIKHHITSPYHASSNGLVERYFRTIKDMAYSSAHTERKDWDEILHIVEFGVRSTTNKSTGKTPFERVLGFLPIFTSL